MFKIRVLVNRLWKARRQGAAQYVLWLKISLDMNICRECISESREDPELVSKSLTKEPDDSSGRK